MERMRLLMSVLCSLRCMVYRVDSTRTRSEGGKHVCGAQVVHHALNR